MVEEKSLTVPITYLTKNGLSAYAEELANLSIEGYTDPLRQFIQLTAIKKVVDKALGLIKPCAIEEADKFEKWDRVWGGVQFQIRQGSLTLDYSGDEQWRELNAKKEVIEKDLKIVKSEIKKREQMLKDRYLDIETGEMNESVRFIRVGDPSLVIFFKEEEEKDRF